MMGADAIRCMRRSLGSEVGDAIPWSDTDKNPSVTLTESGFVATRTSNSGDAGCGAVSGSAKPSGSHYAELQLLGIGRVGYRAYIGFSTTGAKRNGILGSFANSYGYSQTGLTYFNGSFYSGYPAFDVGDVIGIGVNIDGGFFEFFKNGNSLGIEPFSPSGSYVIAWSGTSNGDSVRIVTDPAEMTYAVPAGYSAWSFN